MHLLLTLVKLGHQKCFFLHCHFESEHAETAAYEFLRMGLWNKTTLPGRKLGASAILSTTLSIFHGVRSGIR